MKTLLLILLTSFTFAQDIEIKNETFEFEKVVYWVKDLSNFKDGTKSISCYKIVKGEKEQYLFITNENFKVLRFYSYKEGRWHELELTTLNKTI